MCRSMFQICWGIPVVSHQPTHNGSGDKKLSRCWYCATCKTFECNTAGHTRLVPNMIQALLVAMGAHRWYNSICWMRFPISVLYWSNAQLAPFRRLLLPKCKTPHFSTSYLSSSLEFGITRYYNLGKLWHFGSQYTDLPFHMLIFTFCCTMWSKSINVTDRQTDGWMSC